MPLARKRSVSLSAVRVGVPLIGVVDGINVDFATPEFFVRITGGATIAVHYNGQRIREGVSNDYTLAESGGSGTGWDTVTTAFAPRPGDTLEADYIAQQ